MWGTGRIGGLCGALGGIVVLAWGNWAQELPPQSAARPPAEVVRGDAPEGPAFRGIDAGEVRVNWSQVGLSEAQQQQFWVKRREFQREIAGLREELQALQQALRAEIVKNPADRAALDAVLEKMALVKQRLNEAAVRNLLDLKALLTPEQRTNLEEFHAQIPQDLQNLRLTAEQRRAVGKLMNAGLRKDRRIMGQLQMARTELHELLLSADEPDQARLIEVQRTITDLEMALEMTRVDLFLRMREILTAEQLERYQQFRERKSREHESTPHPDRQKRR